MFGTYAGGPGNKGLEAEDHYNFQHVQHHPPPSSYMRQTGGMRKGTGAGAGMYATMGDFQQQQQQAALGMTGGRPMTSNRGAGYNSAARMAFEKGGAAFDPFNDRAKGVPGSGLSGGALKEKEMTLEDKLREMDKECHRLVEESATLNAMGDLHGALEKAKEAMKKERQLCRQREMNNMLESINIDLTYSVAFNAANQHQAIGNWQEALTTYSSIVKNKQYPHSGRLRVNMGNIYFQQQKYPTAIKMYRMALDQIPSTGKETRFKIMRNVGLAFFRMGQFPDAVDSYETIMSNYPDVKTGFNLLLCYFALGDREKMKHGFMKMLGAMGTEWSGLMGAAGGGNGEGEDETQSEEGPATFQEDDEGERVEDPLKEEMRTKRREAMRLIANGAKLIAPVIENSPVGGFEWVIECLRSHGSASSSSQWSSRVSSELEIAKASFHLRRKEFDAAIEVLKGFEKKDPAFESRAATNLSFLFFLESDFKQAELYADLAVRNDRYNARALVNKGNCLFVAEEFERAKELYLEAIGVEADCVEAIFNLGIVNKQLQRYQEALQAFEKLNSVLPNVADVLYQLGTLCEKMGILNKAVEWFSLIVTPGGRPTDPGVLSILGNLANKMDDEAQATLHYLESYRYSPTNLEVITKLGIYFVRQEVYENAIPFFERAAEIQPGEIKWQLMVASCYRRMGSFQQALRLYEQIHREHPNDIECLRYLVTLCREVGHSDAEEYQVALRRLERQAAAGGLANGGRDADPMGEAASADGPDSTRPGSHRQTTEDEQRDYEEAMPPDKERAKRILASAGQKKTDEDEWGDDDLGQDLLPNI
uniref:Uncharacterized protein n=2 Tax=Chromera velia TaxID=505693 RepID=A0A0G4I5A1_9ALVE|eukprot:Cvel_1839.t1-p1 / transcript=Cvel_1839.t1 / gene=Cvel_1839 / organism=Chromera_velia_CCMP2878 / gene_product=Intraflagellar transport protein 88 homolog, putative / transcript_product=Intraflagellar transport protein 88 homolog, putative / location=Cvel_scaffold68:5770-17118(-) / protein_length=820 / sequence_SO=supercontig / SO=protein_coding / is_pseudo=false